MTHEAKIRQPIITVCGHVDHGKTSVLDRLRGTSIQEAEAGGITQKISFTKYPFEQIVKSCPLLEKNKIPLKIPGFLFIDTPGHAAFTNLRKRGGSLADLAVLVVDIKEGIKPQTAEVISILKANKTPFVIALNKIDTISGWQRRDSVKDSIERLPINVRQDFDTKLFTFQGSIHDHGFDSDLFYDITDFTKKIALVPCSARTGEGISELLFVLCGLSQKFLSSRLEVSKDAKGVVLEIKKDKSKESVEAILYDGELSEGDEIAIASFNEPVIAKIRAIEEIMPLSQKFNIKQSVTAATGIRLHIASKEDLLPGMPFQKVNKNLEQIKAQFKKELTGAIITDKQGIVIKADSLGSLEALMTLLKQSNISIVKAGIGPISKSDVISAKANKTINPLDSIIVGFNVEKEADVEASGVKILTNEVVYKLIEDLEAWRKQRQAEIEKERLMGLATICKLQILHNYVFRNSNPAIFGVKVMGGKLKKDIPLIDDTDEQIARVKAIQVDKESVDEATEGMELALSLTGTNFERQLSMKRFLYANLSESQFKAFKKQKDLLSSSELKVLQEIADLKRRKNEAWGA